LPHLLQFSPPLLELTPGLLELKPRLSVLMLSPTERASCFGELPQSVPQTGFEIRNVLSGLTQMLENLLLVEPPPGDRESGSRSAQVCRSGDIRLVLGPGPSLE